MFVFLSKFLKDFKQVHLGQNLALTTGICWSTVKASVTSESKYCRNCMMKPRRIMIIPDLAVV